MTQNSFSDHIGISQQTLSGYERGIMKPPIDIVIKIAQQCNVSTDWLCGLTDKKNYRNNISHHTDFINFFITLEKHMDISIDEAEFEKGTYHKFGTKNNYSIRFNNKLCIDFFAEWKKMKNLHDNGYIDDGVYALWIEKTMNLYQNLPIKFSRNTEKEEDSF